jgi:hypothetical protein
MILILQIALAIVLAVVLILALPYLLVAAFNIIAWGFILGLIGLVIAGILMSLPWPHSGVALFVVCGLALYAYVQYQRRQGRHDPRS